MLRVRKTQEGEGLRAHLRDANSRCVLFVLRLSNFTRESSRARDGRESEKTGERPTAIRAHSSTKFSEKERESSRGGSGGRDYRSPGLHHHTQYSSRSLPPLDWGAFGGSMPSTLCVSRVHISWVPSGIRSCQIACLSHSAGKRVCN